MIKISFWWINLDCNRKIINSFFVITFSIKWNTSIIIRIRILWIDFYRTRIILNRLVKHIDFVMGESSIEQRFEMVREILQTQRIELNGSVKVISLSGLESLSMTPFSFLFFVKALLLKKFSNGLRALLFLLKIFMIFSYILIALFWLYISSWSESHFFPLVPRRRNLTSIERIVHFCWKFNWIFPIIL